jgi:hypothetical protein
MKKMNKKQTEIKVNNQLKLKTKKNYNKQEWWYPEKDKHFEQFFLFVIKSEKININEV